LKKLFGIQDEKLHIYQDFAQHFKCGAGSGKDYRKDAEVES
jgi:hypothetical protein